MYTMDEFFLKLFQSAHCHKEQHTTGYEICNDLKGYHDNSTVLSNRFKVCTFKNNYWHYSKHYTLKRKSGKARFYI